MRPQGVRGMCPLSPLSSVRYEGCVHLILILPVSGVVHKDVAKDEDQSSGRERRDQWLKDGVGGPRLDDIECKVDGGEYWSETEGDDERVRSSY
jgi:hypothetical protein